LNKKCYRFTRGAVLLLAACVWLASCASKPPPPPVQAHTRIVVGADANPDPSGRPSPVVVRVYQLRDDGEFAAADFFAIYDKEKETLAQSLVSRQEYVLSPGETRVLELPVNAQTRFLGVVAAFRDIRAARWRAVSQAPEKKLTDLLRKHGVTISIATDSVTLAVKD
jgi:type VI secretion system protein VasD